MKDRRLVFWNDDEWKATVSQWPKAVQRGFAKNLRIAQLGGTPQSHAKPLGGFEVQLWELWHRDGQRVIYTNVLAELKNVVYVVDAFNKDASEGKKMRPAIKARLTARAKGLKDEVETLKAAIEQARHNRLH